MLMITNQQMSEMREHAAYREEQREERRLRLDEQREDRMMQFQMQQQLMTTMMMMMGGRNVYGTPSMSNQAAIPPGRNIPTIPPMNMQVSYNNNEEGMDEEHVETYQEGKEDE